MKGIVLLWLCLAVAAAKAAAIGDKCFSCGKLLGDTYVMSSPYYKDRLGFCPDCAGLSTVCFICELPFQKVVDLKDGRVLCLKDAKTAILSGEQAKDIFEDVKRDVRKMLAGSQSFPDRNITFSLADADELRSLARLRRFPSTHNATLGLTRSRAVERDKNEHNIDVLAGMNPAKFVAVCAHEYGHAWLEENCMSGRTLDASAEEGFCELLGWKILSDRHEETEKGILLKNKYTEGQIDAFIKAEQDYNFYLVMKWALAGVDTKLSLTNTARLLILSGEPFQGSASSFSWPPPAAVAPPAPDRLVLKAISGSSRRRFALINGATIGLNETAKVRIASSNVVVRCVDISERSVTIHVNGSPEKTELILKAQ